MMRVSFVTEVPRLRTQSAAFAPRKRVAIAPGRAPLPGRQRPRCHEAGRTARLPCRLDCQAAMPPVGGPAGELARQLAGQLPAQPAVRPSGSRFREAARRRLVAGVPSGFQKSRVFWVALRSGRAPPRPPVAAAAPARMGTGLRTWGSSSWPSPRTWDSAAPHPRTCPRRRRPPSASRDGRDARVVTAVSV